MRGIRFSVCIFGQIQKFPAMKKLFILPLFLLFLPLADLWAQGCSVCTQTANQLGEEGAEGLNAGIVYLALLPLTFILTLSLVWWRYNRKARS